MHDPIFLAGKLAVAAKEDLQVAQDLLDTLMAHRENCVGMAANMIGVRKRIIAFLDESGLVSAILELKVSITLYNILPQKRDFCGIWGSKRLKTLKKTG